jgi:hypothetical protein
MVCSPSPTTVTNRPSVEWSKNVANILVELISLTGSLGGRSGVRTAAVSGL